MPFCEKDMRSIYTATQVTALYSASWSASFRRLASLSGSPSRFTNLVGSGKGSMHYREPAASGNSPGESLTLWDGLHILIHLISPVR